MTGWIKLHRKLFENPIYTNANMLKLWIHCLLKASHAEHDQLVGNQMVKLKPGDFVTGRNALAEEFNKGAKPDEYVSAITLWRWMKNFEKWEMMNIKTTTKFSVISILKWHEHQQDEHQMNSKRTADEQRVNTNKNVKNDKNDKKSNLRRKQVYDTDSPYFILADFMFKEIQKNNPNHKLPELQKWADEFRRLVDIDKRDKKEVSQLIRWVQQDSFEMTNVLSPAKLRKRYDELILKMKRQPKQGQVIQMPTRPVKEFKLDVSEGE